jgi:hypothetical protein
MTFGPITQINAARRAREEQKLSCPWNCLRVGFNITTKKSRHEFLVNLEDIQSRLPEGWHYQESHVAIKDMTMDRVEFLVTGMPRFADGAAVRALLNMIQ